ncbi:MAG: GH3 auxin-responsive promoter family protein [Phycisphaerales bacterium]|nr:GH3 auxin-responsive promoter family protein [Phycisphaerales bacterium]
MGATQRTDTAATPTPPRDRAAPSSSRQPRWTPLIGAGLRARTLRRARRLGDLSFWARHTARIQRAQLRSLLRAAAFTEIGREHGFSRLACLPDSEIAPAFQKALPLADYYRYRTAIARMRENAEPDVLWPGVVMDFAQTSGTTAGDKYIPVSKQMLRSNFLASLDIFATAARFGVRLSRMTSGKCLFLGGSSDLTANAHGVRTGDLSGIVTPLIRWPISEIYAPGPDIALMSHWPSKIEAMAEACLYEDIRMISGMPSWTLVLFERVIQLARQEGRDVSTVREVWPNLELFVHGGVKYSPFDSRVRRLYSGSATGDDIPRRLELYPASEGFIAMQDIPGDPGMRLLSDLGVFYEFVPLERIDDSNAPAFTADQVEKGQRYVVVMTTCAGLWRYIIGDVVEFDTIPARLGAPSNRASVGGRGSGPCRLRIVGRHRHFINAFGENLIVEHIENAVAAAASKTGITIGEFTAAPVYPREGYRAGLELAIEMDPAPPPPCLDEFALAFDTALKQQNVDYTTKRTDDVGMAPPTITPLRQGALHRWMASKGKLGGQHKCPRCANHREIIEGVIAAS